MCELLGLSARQKLTVNKILKIFYGHGDDHPHGWGLALFREDGTPAIEKEPVRATASSYLKTRLEAGIEAASLIGHIRLATIGTLDYVNCHPFVMRDTGGRPWTIAHNGTIFDFPPLDAYLKRQEGATDSERVALYLVDAISDETARIGRPLSFEERFDVLECAIVALTRKNNKVNLLVFDGEYLYAHSNFAGSLHYLQQDGHAWLSTRPLTDGDWKALPFRRLCAFKDGELVRTGEDHHGEYFVNQGDLDMIYMAYSSL